MSTQSKRLFSTDSNKPDSTCCWFVYGYNDMLGSSQGSLYIHTDSRHINVGVYVPYPYARETDLMSVYSA